MYPSFYLNFHPNDNPDFESQFPEGFVLWVYCNSGSIFDFFTLINTLSVNV